MPRLKCILEKWSAKEIAVILLNFQWVCNKKLWKLGKLSMLIIWENSPCNTVCPLLREVRTRVMPLFYNSIYCSEKWSLWFFELILYVPSFCMWTTPQFIFLSQTLPILRDEFGRGMWSWFVKNNEKFRKYLPSGKLSLPMKGFQHGQVYIKLVYYCHKGWLL